MLGRGRERSRRLIASNLQSTIRDLQRRKARGRRGLALIEGVRLVEEALAAGLTVRGAPGGAERVGPRRGGDCDAELARLPVSGVAGTARALAHEAGAGGPQR